MQKSLNDFKSIRIKFVEKFRNIIATVGCVINEIINVHLFNWRENQVLVGNGFNSIDPQVLNKIQNWCENLAKLLWLTRKHLLFAPMYYEQLNIEDEMIPNMIVDFFSQINGLLQVLVQQTAIVEVQPSQVLKTNTRFATTIRLLVGGALNIKMISPNVEVSIVSEQQAQIAQQFQQKTELHSGDLMNCSGRFEFNEHSFKLAAIFRSMQLKKICRSEKKGAENVTDEKFALLFQSTFTIGDGELNIYMSVLSIPIVVIVHGNQEPQSHATILWDNSFSVLNRRPFHVESSVSWVLLGIALKMKFCAPTNPISVVPNAEIFSNEMIQSLCNKALHEHLQNDAKMITWAQFCKDPLPDRSFTFWEWFYAAMRFIREHLCDLWNQNYIFGFIDKLSAEKLLLSCEPGTFLLRFSDSELGGLTIASVNLDANNVLKVFHIQPLTSKNLSFRSLPDRILDLVELKTLYPNISKAEAFGKHASTRGPAVEGYVPMDVHASLPRPITNNNQGNLMNSNSNSSISSPVPMSSPIGAFGNQTPTFTVQLPDFNFFLGEYEGTVMDHDWLMDEMGCVINEIIHVHLFNWRENQVLVGNGFKSIDPQVLNKIQNWCENLAKLLWLTRKHLLFAPMYYEQLNIEDEMIPNMIVDFFSQVDGLLLTLVKQTVIVEVQPSQVLKTNTRFATTIRLLVGGALNIKMISPNVDVSIVSEQQAQMSQQLQEKTVLNSGDLLNCSGRFEFNEHSFKLAAIFRAMQLKKICRSEKRGAENVTDEKFALLFQSTFTIGDGELNIYMSVLSMPIVVIVHGNQEPQSHATILWDNSFSVLNRRPFDVESAVPWKFLGAALKMKFCAPTNPVSVVPNAEIFSNEMIQSLCNKALHEHLQNDAKMITWAQFCKDPLPDRSFTFWEWFYAAMRFIREHLCDLWNQNYIFGFIDKLSAEQLLLSCEPGTFLLRFSDSELGGLTIASVNLDANNVLKVFHIQPLTSKVLTFHSLPDRILDLVELKTLYPNISKAEAFGKHASTRGPAVKGYVPMDVHASLPRPSTSNNQKDLMNFNSNSSISSSVPVSPAIGAFGNETPTFTVQLPDFNFFLGDYEIMDHDWSNGSELPQVLDPHF
ncbi:unnamed protein product [Diamesa hyperborea]